MSLQIDYEAADFPAPFLNEASSLDTTWGKLIGAALTVGRRNGPYVLLHGTSSVFEAVFRISLVRMALEVSANDRLSRTQAFVHLDPTEKGMISYFLGMAFCKLFASEKLGIPSLLHLDSFPDQVDMSSVGRSRPDLIGEDASGQWHVFECKGRSSAPSAQDIQKAKGQARRVVFWAGARVGLHIGSFSYFKSEDLNFYWCDPEPEPGGEIALSEPGEEWRYCYEPAMALLKDTKDPETSAASAATDVTVDIQPDILARLQEGKWLLAHKLALEMGEDLKKLGFQSDGVRVVTGASWGS